MNVNVLDNRKHGRDEMDATRDTLSMHGFQEFHTELTLDQLGLKSTEEN